MALIALTESERNILLGSQEFKEICQQKVLTKAAYFMGLTSAADVQAMKNRLHSAAIENNPNILLNDGFLTSTFEFNMLTRDFSFKDDSQVGLVPQVVAYLNASSRFDFLVDDYFVDRTAGMIH